MATPKRTTQGGTYFITTTTDARRRIFQTDRNARLFLDTLQHYRQQGYYKLHAFVVMPDHVHLILTPQSVTIERAVGMIKGGFSHRLASRFPVWQRGYSDHRLRNADDLRRHIDYVHLNPVRARLCLEAWEYPFSSAYRAPSAAEAASKETFLVARVNPCP